MEAVELARSSFGWLFKSGESGSRYWQDVAPLSRGSWLVQELLCRWGRKIAVPALPRRAKSASETSPKPEPEPGPSAASPVRSHRKIVEVACSP